METYYKYAERQADSFVNWGEIGKNLTDMLQKEFQIREEKKDAIDKATRESLKTLSNQPTGQHEGLNTWSLKYADEAREAILLQDRLLKKGSLKLKDYTIMRQNLNDGTDELYSAIKGYQDIFKVKMDRLRSSDPKNKSQQIEVDLMSMIEGFSDFSKSKVLIDPTNFTVSVGLMEPDPDNAGVMRVSKNVATTSFLKKIQDTKFDYFDSEAFATDTAKNVGSYLTTVIGQGTGLEGQITTIEDALAKPATEKYIRQKIRSQLSNPYHVTSILTEDLIEDDKENQYVSSISGKEGNVIKYVFDGQSNLPIADLTEEQMKAAEDYMYGMIVAKLDYKKIEGRYSKPQPNVVKADETPSGGASYAENIEKFKTKLKAVKPKRDNYVFTGTEAITVGNIENLLSSDPATIGKFKVSSANNVVTITDNDNVVIGSYDLSRTQGTGDLKQRERYLDDLLDKVTNYSISKDPTIIGVSLMTSPQQQSGGVGSKY